MAKVVVAVSTQPTVVPLGPPQGQWRIALLDESQAVFATQDVAAPVAEFDPVPPGNYTAVGVALDVAGNQLAGTTPVTKAFTVDPETMTIEAPVEALVTVTLGVSGGVVVGV